MLRECRAILLLHALNAQPSSAGNPRAWLFFGSAVPYSSLGRRLNEMANLLECRSAAGRVCSILASGKRRPFGIERGRIIM